MIKKNLAVFLLILFFPVISSAALWTGKTARYVCDTSVCGQSPGAGTSWSNAFDDIPGGGDVMTRDYVYYVADGSYNNAYFDDAVDGTKWIYIVKATVADHGTETGWLDTYGDGQANISSRWQFLTGYYHVDGNGTHTIPSDDTNDY